MFIFTVENEQATHSLATMVILYQTARRHISNIIKLIPPWEPKM